MGQTAGAAAAMAAAAAGVVMVAAAVTGLALQEAVTAATVRREHKQAMAVQLQVVRAGLLELAELQQDTLAKPEMVVMAARQS